MKLLRRVFTRRRPQVVNVYVQNPAPVISEEELGRFVRRELRRHRMVGR